MSVNKYYHGRLSRQRRKPEGMVDSNPKEYLTQRSLSKDLDF